MNYSPITIYYSVLTFQSSLQKKAQLKLNYVIYQRLQAYRSYDGIEKIMVGKMEIEGERKVEPTINSHMAA